MHVGVETEQEPDFSLDDCDIIDLLSNYPIYSPDNEELVTESEYSKLFDSSDNLLRPFVGGGMRNTRDTSSFASAFWKKNDTERNNRVIIPEEKIENVKRFESSTIGVSLSTLVDEIREDYYQLNQDDNREEKHVRQRSPNKNSCHPSKPSPKKRKWKTQQIRRGLKAFCDNMIEESARVFQPLFIKKYTMDDPFGPKNPENDVETYNHFLQNFRYSMATKSFQCALPSDKRYTEMPPVIVVFYQPQFENEKYLYIPLHIIRMITGIHISKTTDQLKKYAEDAYFDTSFSCCAIGKSGGFLFRKRKMVNPYSFYLICQWILRLDTYKQYAGPLNLIMKYLDVEFGAFWGSLQEPPFSHTTQEILLDVPDESKIQQYYTQYCLKRNEKMQDIEHIIQTDISSQKNNPPVSSPPKFTENGSASNKKKRKANSSKSNSKKKSRGIPIDSVKGKERIEDDEPNVICEESVSKIDQSSPCFEPFGITIWCLEYIPDIKARCPVKYSLEFDVQIITSKPSRISICKKWCDNIRKSLFDDETANTQTKKNIWMEKVARKLYDEKVRLYGGSEELHPNEFGERKDCELRDICMMKRIFTEGNITMPTKICNKIDMEWARYVDSFTVPMAMPKSEKIRLSQRNPLGIPIRKRLLHFHCTKPTSSFRKVTSINKPYFISTVDNKFIPMPNWRKQRIMEMIHSLLGEWPEECIFLDVRKSENSVVPFWILLFFALTMTPKERECNGSPFSFCYGILSNIENWFRNNLTFLDTKYLPDDLSEIKSGINLFRIMLEHTENALTSASLQQSKFLPRCGIDKDSILISLIRRLITERDTLLLHIKDDIKPVLESNNLLQQLRNHTNPLYHRRIEFLTEYADNVYSS